MVFQVFHFSAAGVEKTDGSAQKIFRYGNFNPHDRFKVYGSGGGQCLAQCLSRCHMAARSRGQPVASFHASQGHGHIGDRVACDITALQGIAHPLDGGLHVHAGQDFSCFVGIFRQETAYLHGIAASAQPGGHTQADRTLMALFAQFTVKGHSGGGFLAHGFTQDDLRVA